MIWTHPGPGYKVRRIGEAAHNCSYLSKQDKQHLEAHPRNLLETPRAVFKRVHQLLVFVAYSYGLCSVLAAQRPCAAASPERFRSSSGQTVRACEATHPAPWYSVKR